MYMMKLSVGYILLRSDAMLASFQQYFMRLKKKQIICFMLFIGYQSPVGICHSYHQRTC